MRVREILREKVRERFEPLKNLLMQLFTQLLTHFVLLAAGRLGSRWNLSEMLELVEAPGIFLHLLKSLADCKH